MMDLLQKDMGGETLQMYNCYISFEHDFIYDFTILFLITLIIHS